MKTNDNITFLVYNKFKLAIECDNKEEIINIYNY